MSNDMRARYREALEIVNMRELAKHSGRGYRTIQAYRLGERRITEAACREMVAFLRDRAARSNRVADRLEAALEEEVS